MWKYVRMLRLMQAHCLTLEARHDHFTVLQGDRVLSMEASSLKAVDVAVAILNGTHKEKPVKYKIVLKREVKTTMGSDTFNTWFSQGKEVDDIINPIRYGISQTIKHERKK